MRKARWVALFAAIAGAVGLVMRRRAKQHEMLEMEISDIQAA